MNRRDFLRYAGVGAAGMAAMALPNWAGAAPVADKKLNFLFILTDDQRFSAMGAAGCSEIKTPAMDKLAAEGLNFTQASIMGGNSAAVCMPSRAMIMTGASLYKCGGGIPSNFETMPQLLGKNGYATFATGKWHNGEESLLRSFEFGEANFLGGMGNHFKTSVHDISAGKLTGKREITEFDAEAFTDATIKFMKERPKDKPFFAYLAFKTPHDPRVVPEKFHKMYDASKITLPPNFLPEHPFDNGEMRIRDEMLAKFPRTPEEIKQHIAAYYAATSATDEQIGRVLKALEELGLTENTVVIFTGDNGLAVGQHGLMGKQNVYDHSIRVPLVLRGPGIPQGRKTEALCQLFDLCPTLLDMAGIAAPVTADGRNLGPVIRGEKPDVRDATFHCYKGVQHAARTHDAKLIEYLVRGKRTTQLFDLKNDPWEANNLADDMTQTALLKTMSERLDELRKEYTASAMGGSAEKGRGKSKGGTKKQKPMENAEAGE